MIENMTLSLFIDGLIIILLVATIAYAVRLSYYLKKFKESQETSAVPIIMITGIRRAMNLPFHFESDEELLPVKSVLEKPVKPETLLDAVAKALG